MTQIETPSLTSVMVFITNIISTKTLLLFTILLFLFFAYKKKYHKVFLVLLAIGGATVLELLLKALIQRARPENALIDASVTYSFPSGHATLAIVFFSLMVYFFKDYIQNKVYRSLFISINILLILLIGLSRIYLRVHWFTDVLGGFLLGILWVYFCILLFRKTKENTHS